jgi:integrase
LTTAYAAGLRASEAVSLKVANIDSDRMVIRVQQGTGSKDRYVMLSAQLRGILRTYWRLARPKDWLFPGRDPGKPIEVNVLHAACRSACAASGLTKRYNKTVVGDVKFGRQGEWSESRVPEVQFQHIKGTDLGPERRKVPGHRD